MRNYKRKTERGNTSETLLRQAADAVIKEGKSVKTVARELEICHMTLHRFVTKLKVGKIPAIGYKPRLIFTLEQEKQLVNYILKCSSIYFNLLPGEVRKLAYECAVKFSLENIPPSWHKNRETGADWLTGFIKRNPTLSISGRPISAEHNDQPGPSNIQKFSENDRQPKLLTTLISVQNDKQPQHVTINRSDIYQTGSSTLNTVQEHQKPAKTNSTAMFSPEIVKPLPKAPPRLQTSTKRLIRKTAILTNPPEKNALAGTEQAKKETKKNEDTAKKEKRKNSYNSEDKSRGKEKAKSQEKAKRRVLQGSESDSDKDLEWYCKICCDSYSNSCQREQWIECTVCKNWAHVKCLVKGDEVTYVCPKCEPDKEISDE